MIKTFIKHHVADYALTYALDNAIINLMFPELKKISTDGIIEKWKSVMGFTSLSNDDAMNYLLNTPPVDMIANLLENQTLMNQIGNINNPNKPRSSQ